MRTIITLLASCGLLFVTKKVNQADESYKTTPESKYIFNGKTYAIKDAIKGGLGVDSVHYFVDAFYHGNLKNGETVKGDVTIRFNKKPKDGTKIYAVEHGLDGTSISTDSIAVRYDYMVGSSVPNPSVISTGKKGETVTVTKRNGKLTITSKGITMNYGSKLSFTIVQR